MRESEINFWKEISKSQTITKVLENSQSLQIPNWCIGAGCLAQTIWNLKAGNPTDQNIKDIDWVYFDDQDLSEEGERENEARVQEHFSDINLKFDVKNQARVHLWYANKFGYEIPPYSSVEAAISTWPTTATTVAISNLNGKTRLIAPFGIEDLMSYTVRPNKAQITEEIYLLKVVRWKKYWPFLKILPWDAE